MLNYSKDLHLHHSISLKFLTSVAMRIKKNKYAIHAYTHGLVTGSGSSVVLVLSLVVASAPGLGS